MSSHLPQWRLLTLICIVVSLVCSSYGQQTWLNLKYIEGSKIYHVLDNFEATTFSDAVNTCEARNWRLIAPTSAEEDTVIGSFAKQALHISTGVLSYVAVRKVSCKYVNYYTEEEVISDSDPRWDIGSRQPSSGKTELCTALVQNSNGEFKWHDLECDWDIAVVCEEDYAGFEACVISGCQDSRGTVSLTSCNPIVCASRSCNNLLLCSELENMACARGWKSNSIVKCKRP